MTQWHVIETLASGQSSLVWSRGRRTEWQSVGALARRTEVNPAPVVDHIRATSEPVDAIVTGVRGEQRRIIAVPTIGPDGLVHAVSLRITSPDDDPATDPAPRLGAMTFDPSTYTIAQTADSYMMTSNSPDPAACVRKPGVFLRKVFAFDAVAELTDHCLNPAGRPMFRGTLGIKHDNGSLLSFHGVSRFDASTGRVRGFAHDITDHEPLALNPETLLNISPAATSNSATVLIGFPADEQFAPVPSYWVTPRPAALHDVDHAGPNRVHPDDVPKLLRVQQLLAGAADSNASLCLQVRIHGRDGWVLCSLQCARWPGANINSAILMCQLTTT